MKEYKTYKAAKRNARTAVYCEYKYDANGRAI